MSNKFTYVRLSGISCCIILNGYHNCLTRSIFSITIGIKTRISWLIRHSNSQCGVVFCLEIDAGEGASETDDIRSSDIIILVGGTATIGTVIHVTAASIAVILIWSATNIVDL